MVIEPGCWLGKLALPAWEPLGGSFHLPRRRGGFNVSEGFTEPCPRSPWRSAAGAESSFCKRPEIVNIFVFVDWIVCVVTAQICHGRAEVATGSTEMNRRRCVPAKRHLPKQAAGQIGPTGGHSRNPGLDSALASEGNSLTGTRASCLLSPWAPHRWAGALPERSVCTQRHTLHDWHVPDAGPAARTQDGSASEAMTFLHPCKQSEAF